MRLLLVLLLSLGTLNAQNLKEVEEYRKVKPKFESLDSAVNNPHSKYYFTTLIDRFTSNDTTLNIDEAYHLYYGSEFCHGCMPRYKFKDEIISKKRLDSLLKLDPMSKENHREIIEIAKKMIKESPLELKYYSLSLESYKVLEWQDSVQVFEAKLRMLTNAILASGEKVNDKLQIYTVGWQDEEDLITILKLQDIARDFGHTVNIYKFKENKLGISELQFKRLLHTHDCYTQTDNKEMQKYLDDGLEKLNAKYSTEAMELFQKAAKDSAIDHWALNNIGVAYEQLGQLDKALDYYNKAIERKHNLALAWNNKANIFRKQRLLDSILTIYPKALRLELKSEDEVQAVLCAFYFDFNKFVDANRIAKKLYEYDPKKLEYCSLYGLTSMRVNKIELAKILFKEAIALDESKFIPICRLSQIYMAEKDTVKSLNILNNFIERNPDQKEAIRFRSLMFPSINGKDDYKEILAEQTKEAESNTDLLLSMAFTYLENNDTAQAREVLQKILDSEPYNKYALKLLFEIYISERNIPLINSTLDIGKRCLDSKLFYQSKILLGIYNNQIDSVEELRKMYYNEEIDSHLYFRALFNLQELYVKELQSISDSNIRLQIFMDILSHSFNFDSVKQKINDPKLLCKINWLYKIYTDIENIKFSEIDESTTKYSNDIILDFVKMLVLMKNNERQTFITSLDILTAKYPNNTEFLKLKFEANYWDYQKHSFKSLYNELITNLEEILDLEPNNPYYSSIYNKLNNKQPNSLQY